MRILKRVGVVRKFIYIGFVIAFMSILYLKGLFLSKWKKWDEDCICLDLKDIRKEETRTNKTVQIFGAQTTLWGKHDHRLVKITWAEFQKSGNALSGNPLIDNYGENDPGRMGEDGSGIILAVNEKEKASHGMEKYNINVYASDKIPLNRMVPDARFPGCAAITYPDDLPTASIIIPLFDEWPSILLRTVYSIINRTPRNLLKEIILVDDCSQLEQLKAPLDKYIEEHFPKGIVNIIRLPERRGLVQARLAGFRNSTGDVFVVFDSHMEVNVDWLQPLLVEIKKDRKIITMANLDYVQKDTFEYRYYTDHITRYGFDWSLNFFETYFRNDQVGVKPEDPRPGTVMVGAGFAVEKKFFEEIGTFDKGMNIWGGENLELAWRAWLCGGRLVHVPCSHIGHVKRVQPYTFPGGREMVQQFNYKRAVEVWMEPEHKELIYNIFPNMRTFSLSTSFKPLVANYFATDHSMAVAPWVLFLTLDVGDLSKRIHLKEALKCKPFSWFIDNIWPELCVLNKNVTAWGSARNLHTNKCLDNHYYLFQAPEELFAEPCHFKFHTQGFSMTNEKFLRTSLQCVVVKENVEGTRPKLEDCLIGPRDTWVHKQGDFIMHEKTGLCLDLDDRGPVMKKCDSQVPTQLWTFNTYFP